MQRYSRCKNRKLIRKTSTVLILKEHRGVEISCKRKLKLAPTKNTNKDAIFAYLLRKTPPKPRALPTYAINTKDVGNGIGLKPAATKTHTYELALNEYLLRLGRHFAHASNCLAVSFGQTVS